MSKYYVWNLERNRPSKSHVSFPSAVVEAERLAKSNEGQTFKVLECKATICVKKRMLFSHVEIGQKFRQGNRVLMKTEDIVTDYHGEMRVCNAIRLSPANVSGRYSCFRPDSIVKELD